MENETVIRRKTILRKAGYLGAVYRGQYDVREMFPFVGIVLFWGRKHWKAPRSLRQLFCREGVQERYEKYIDNIELPIYEMACLPERTRACFHSDMRIVVDYLVEGKNYLPTGQKIVHLEAVLLMLKALTGDVRYEEIIPELQEERNRKGAVSMCELLDKYENRGITKGMERVNELIRRMIGDGRSGEISRAVSDKEYQKQLLLEYGL